MCIRDRIPTVRPSKAAAIAAERKAERERAEAAAKAKAEAEACLLYTSTICSGSYIAVYFLTISSASPFLALLKNSVFVQNGQTAVTVMPDLRTSLASALEKLRTNAFVAA